MSRTEPLHKPFGVAAIAVAIAVVAALAWLALSPRPLPQPAGADAPRARFSAARAFAHVQALARTPRPIASDANRAARDYLIAQLRELGLEPEVQTATVRKVSVSELQNVHVTLAVVHNILVRKPGSAPDHARRPALLFAARYDSGEATQGAAGAASAAAMLETLRALRAGPELLDDAVFLFADGEAVGGLGTQAFAEQHRWARDTALVLKFDNPGNGGPLVLYDSHRAGGQAIGGWARSPGARGSSLISEVYRSMPNAVGIGALATLDAAVLQFATVGGAAAPLGARDTPARLELASLQHEGDAMLAMARHFGAQPLARPTEESRVYFELPRVGIVHYSPDAVWPLARLACLLALGGCCFAIQRAPLEPADIVKGAFAFALLAVVPALAAYELWHHAPMLHAGFARSQPGPHEQWYLLAVAALGAGLFLFLQRRLHRWIGHAATALGAMLCAAGLLVAASWLAPGASYVLAWPLFAALGAFAALHSRRMAALTQAARLLVVLAGAAPAVVLIAPPVRDACAALSLERMNLPMALLALLLGLCTAPLAMLGPRYAVRTLVLASLCCFGVARSAVPAPETMPAPNPLTYYKDMPTWRAYWMMAPTPLDGWTRQVFPNLPEPRRFVEVFGWDSADLWYAPAPRSALAFPEAVLLKNEDEPKRHVEFTLQSKNRAPDIELWIDGGKPVRTSVNGIELTAAESRTWALSLYGMEDRRLHFALDLAGQPTFLVHVQERIPGLPAEGLSARPAALRPLVPLSGTTIAADTLVFR